MTNTTTNGSISGFTVLGEKWQYCAKCGRKVEPDHNYCCGCGTQIGTLSAVPWYPTPNYPIWPSYPIGPTWMIGDGNTGGNRCG